MERAESIHHPDYVIMWPSFRSEHTHCRRLREVRKIHILIYKFQQAFTVLQRTLSSFRVPSSSFLTLLPRRSPVDSSQSLIISSLPGLEPPERCRSSPEHNLRAPGTPPPACAALTSSLMSRNRCLPVYILNDSLFPSETGWRGGYNVFVDQLYFFFSNDFYSWNSVRHSSLMHQT